MMIIHFMAVAIILLNAILFPVFEWQEAHC